MKICSMQIKLKKETKRFKKSSHAKKIKIKIIQEELQAIAEKKIIEAERSKKYQMIKWRLRIQVR